MKKAILILGGLMALGIGAEVTLNNEKPAPAPAPAPQIDTCADCIAPEQMEIQIDKMNSILKNCEKDTRCEIYQGQKVLKFQSKDLKSIKEEIKLWTQQTDKNYQK